MNDKIQFKIDIKRREVSEHWHRACVTYHPKYKDPMGKWVRIGEPMCYFTSMKSARAACRKEWPRAMDQLEQFTNAPKKTAYFKM